MERRRRVHAAQTTPKDADAATMRRPRRAVVDNMRRKIERALAVADAAEDLAKAAQAVVIAAEAEQMVLDSRALRALRRALTRYREVHGD